MVRLDRDILFGVGMVALAVLLVYLPVRDFDFVSLDDPAALFENPLVRCGFSFQGLPQVFAVGKGQPWQPLPLFAHAMALNFFGSHAGAHHLLSLGVHLVNACLLFLILFRTTGDRWKSALAAMLFAVLPVNVGTVAWIAQLRTLLCAMFCLGGMFFYVRGRGGQGAKCFLPVFLCHFLALLCGPEAIIFPVMLILLDYWSLSRLAAQTGLKQLLAEKWPLVLLSLMGTLMAAIPYSGEQVSFDIGNAIGNSLLYTFACLRKVFWPDDLTVLYPYFLHKEWILYDFIIMFLLGATWFAHKILKMQPALFSGWLWFLLNLAGIPFWLHSPTQFNLADWHVYIPSMGLAWAVAWMAPPIHRKMPGKDRIIILALIAGLLLCGVGARDYLGTWKNDRELFRRNLHVYPENPVALTGLANWLYVNTFYDLAMVRYSQALVADPNYAPAHYHLANALADEKKIAEAEAHYRHAILIRPSYVQALNQLGNLLVRTGRPREALRYLEASVRNDPALEVPRLNLANVLVVLGRLDLAEEQYRAALELRPSFGEANAGLADVLVQRGRFGEAMECLEKNLEAGFDDANTNFSLGDIHLQMGDYSKAASCFRKSIAARPGFVSAHNSLGAALLMRGQVQGAIENFLKALELDPNYSKAQKNLEYAQTLITRPERGN
ncbi:MAG: tetratricopeptide repeat protein [Desulfatibacillum sp.]|nr:tetratricopeptide repeat protein [Desulfatibacillum sp.]